MSITQGAAVHLVDVLSQEVAEEVYADALAHLAHPFHYL